MIERDDFDTGVSWQRIEDLYEEYQEEPEDQKKRMRLRRELHRKGEGIDGLLDLDKGFENQKKKHGKEKGT
jgi:hypothetical protein